MAFWKYFLYVFIGLTGRCRSFSIFSRPSLFLLLERKTDGHPDGDARTQTYGHVVQYGPKQRADPYPYGYSHGQVSAGGALILILWSHIGTF